MVLNPTPSNSNTRQTVDAALGSWGVVAPTYNLNPEAFPLPPLQQTGAAAPHARVAGRSSTKRGSRAHRQGLGMFRAWVHGLRVVGSQNPEVLGSGFALATSQAGLRMRGPGLSRYSAEPACSRQPFGHGRLVPQTPKTLQDSLNNPTTIFLGILGNVFWFFCSLIPVT